MSVTSLSARVPSFFVWSSKIRLVYQEDDKPQEIPAKPFNPPVRAFPVTIRSKSSAAAISILFRPVD